MARLVWLKEGLTQPANDEPVNNERLYNDDKPKSPIQVFHYHNDHLGTPNELTNQDGEVIWLADYYAWGETRVEMCWEHILASQGESCARVNGEVIWHEQAIEQIQVAKEHLQPLRFQGQYYDEETGLHYNRFRYFDPDLGMFTTRDPIGLLGGNNVFQYAPNPIGWIDPFGLSKENSCVNTGAVHQNKTAKEMADDLYKEINKNSVTYQTPNKIGHIDIAGKEHFDKKTNTNYPIPHVQESPVNINPKTGERQPIKKKEEVRNATKADIRTARKLAIKKGLLK